MNSVFKVIAALFVCVTVTAALSFTAWAGQSAENTQSQSCPENKCKPYDPRFKDLERVAIYVHLPAKYKYAVECHEKIEECVKRREDKDFPERDFEIRQRLIEPYKDLPQSMHPDNLLTLLKTRIEQEVMPHVKSQETCRKAEVIIDRGNKDSYLLDDLLHDPNALIVDVSVKFFDDTKPKISVLYLYAYRVGGDSHNAFNSALMSNTFLFLGAGIQDPDINLMLENYNFTYIESHPHYFLSASDVHEDLKGSLRTNRNLKVIQYDKIDASYSGLPLALEELLKLVDEAREDLAKNSEW